jgi:hypothetical protein
MGSARVEIHKYSLLQALGLDYFDGEIKDVKNNLDTITIDIEGNDSRLPQQDNFPSCDLVCQSIKTHFKVIEETNNIYKLEKEGKK